MVLFGLMPALMAIPARPGKIVYTQPDGSRIEIYRHGDEWGHWTTDAAGRVLQKDKDGFFRVMEGVDAETAARAASIRRAAIRRQGATVARKGEHVAVGQKHFLVILVEFSDLSFSMGDANTAFTNLLNQEGYSVNGGTGSAHDFYYDNSHGYFEPLFDVYGPVTLSNTKAYYGGNDSNGNDKKPEYAVKEGCEMLNGQINFAQYDNDGDEAVDLVFMYYAGYGEADSDDDDSIWPHQWELSSAGLSLTLDGKKVDKYACTNELVGYGTLKGKLCGIGTACHEFGHAMGLPDFYDTDYTTNGQAAAMFSFSTMDSGAYNNEGRTPACFTVEERIMLGWLDETEAIKEFTKPGNITLQSVNHDIAYKIPTDQDGEYFLLECRGSDGWDAHLLAHGLTVTHIDKSNRTVTQSSGSSTAYNLWYNWEAKNAINENGKHPCCYIIPSADQSNLLFGHTLYQGYYYFDDEKAPQIPFPGSKNVTSYTPKSWNGVETEISLTNIAYANDQVTFRVEMPSSGLDYPVIANPENGVYAHGSSFALEIVESENYTVSSVKWYFDETLVQGTSLTLNQDGIHTVEAEVTLDDGRTMTVTLEILVG